MAIHINSQLVIICVFYFIFSAVLAHVFRRSDFFVRIFLVVVFFGVFGQFSKSYTVEVFVSCVFGIIYIFIEPIVRTIENVFAGFSYRVRLIASLIGTILYGIRWVLRLVLIPIANTFTWFYNLLSRTFRWNRVFIPLTEQFKRRHRQAESSRERKESTQSRHSGTGKTNKTNSADSEQEEYIRRAKEKVKQAREEAEKAEREEEQRKNDTAGDRRTPRQILGLGETFTLEELKRAYRSAASRYHPDKHLGMSETFKREAEAEFVKVQNAYKALMKEFR